jgi:hypothetical protein
VLRESSAKAAGKKKRETKQGSSAESAQARASKQTSSAKSTSPAKKALVGTGSRKQREA